LALIELTRPPRTPAPVRPPVHSYRRVGLVLCLALVALLGGAAVGEEVAFRPAGRLQVGENENFAIVADRLVDVRFAPQPVVTAWATAPMRKLWSRTQPAWPEDSPYYISGGTADVLMISEERATTVLDMHTGERLWQSPTPLQMIDADTGLVLEERFRPGTEYDQESGDPGRLYGTTSSTLHTEPAQSTDVRGVDLRSGRTLWAVSEPGSITAGYFGEDVVIISATRLAVLDAKTGDLVRQATLPKNGGKGPAWGEVADGTILVHYAAYGEGGPVTGWDLATLTPRWTEDEVGELGGGGGCTGLTCLRRGDGFALVDSRTGRLAWRTETQDALVLPLGRSQVLEISGEYQSRIAERDTGRTVAELPGWEMARALPGDQGFVMLRTDGPRTMIGLLVAGERYVRILGSTEALVQSCEAGVTVLACRTPAGVEVYRFRG
jgi:hypothetical protein